MDNSLVIDEEGQSDILEAEEEERIELDLRSELKVPSGE